MKMSGIKKLILTLAVSAAFVLPVIAQDKTPSEPIWHHGDNKSSLMYQNFEIYKIYDAKEVYVVFYARNGIKMGQVSIPKSWAKEEPRRLELRTNPIGINPYMSYITKDGEFYKVWLTIPSDKKNTVWGIIPYGTQLPDSTSIDTLTIQY